MNYKLINMEIALHSDIFKYHLVNKLSCKDLYFLKQVNKQYHGSINLHDSFIDAINNRLRLVFGDDLEEFKLILKETESFISGSFIIQCILDEWWDDSDIDLFTKYYDNFELVVDDDENILKTHNKIKIDTFLYHKSDHFGYCEHPNSIYKGSNVTNYKIQDKEYQVQLIKIKMNGSMKSFINKDFDFDICKNSYYINDRERVSVYGIHNLCLKKTEFRSTTHLNNSIGRYHKYKRRGFEFTNIDKLDYEKIAKDSGIIFIFRVGCKDDIPIVREKLLCTNPFTMEKMIGTRYNKIEGDMEIINASSCRAAFGLYHHDKAIVLYESEYFVKACGDKCLIKMCKPELKHVHYQDKRFDSGLEYDLIFIIYD